MAPSGRKIRRRKVRRECFCFMALDARYIRSVILELEKSPIPRSLPEFSIPVDYSKWARSSAQADFWTLLQSVKRRLPALKRLQTRAQGENFDGMYTPRCEDMERTLLLLRIGLELERQWQMIGARLEAVARIANLSTRPFEIKLALEESNRWVHDISECAAKVVPDKIVHYSSPKLVIAEREKFEARPGYCFVD